MITSRLNCLPTSVFLESILDVRTRVAESESESEGVGGFWWVESELESDFKKIHRLESES